MAVIYKIIFFALICDDRCENVLQFWPIRASSNGNGKCRSGNDLTLLSRPTERQNPDFVWKIADDLLTS